jgi:hypothetical protein
MLDGTVAGVITTDIGNGLSTMAYSRVYTLNAGSHTIYLSGYANMRVQRLCGTRNGYEYSDHSVTIMGIDR